MLLCSREGLKVARVDRNSDADVIHLGQSWRGDGWLLAMSPMSLMLLMSPMSLMFGLFSVTQANYKCFVVPQ